MDDIIGENHPSFGTGQAWFQFAVLSPDGAVRKLILVEAKNPYAVYTIERIVLKDGRASDTVFLTAVFRQCPGIGMRSDLIDECSYADFLIDLVDPAKLTEDPVIATAFRSSLSDEEAAYASRKIKAMSADAPQAAPPPSAPSKDLISNALVKMGFKRVDVDKFVASQPSSFFSMPVEGQIRAALAALSS